MLQRLMLLALGIAAVLFSVPASGGQSPPPAPAPTSRVWSAKWIWTPGDPSPKNSYTYFRKSLELENTPKEAKIHLTADSRYQLFVNGSFVGRGPVRSDRRWLYYDTWDLAPHLKKGKNVVAVLVHHYGEWTFQYMHGRGGLLAEVVGPSGRQLARTDASWRTLRSEAWATGQPRMSIQLGFNEIFDARKAPQAWAAASFDDSAWQPVTEIGSAGMEPWPHLTARDIPAMLETPLRAAKVLETVEVEPAPDAQFVDLLALMDRKQWAVAYLTTTLISPQAQEVELSFGSDDAVKVWVNNQPALGHLVSRGAAPDQERVRVTLQAGANTLLAKVVQGHSDWGFYFRTGSSRFPLKQEAGSTTGAAWRVVGPFPYERDDTLARGFDAVFWPELGEPAGNRVGKDLVWKTVKAASSVPAHVSQAMAQGRRKPLAQAEVKNPDAIIDGGPTGALIKTTPTAQVSFLIDFGKEVCGFPRFRVKGAKGGEVIDLGYGEVLQDASGGYVPQSAAPPGLNGGGGARLNPDRDGVHYADRYVCRAGDQTFQTFDKRGFRYLQIDVRNADGLDLSDVSLIFSTYPVAYRGAFSCSDERLNKIWEIGRWTAQLNMEDGFTDCPWRERGQWWGDARVEALIGYYAFGDQALIKKCLRQQGQSLNDEGLTWGVYPTDWDGGKLPSFTLIWVATLWDTYEYTGDQGIVKELFPKVRTSLDKFFAPRVGPRGLLKDIPYWVFIDWAPVDDKGEMGSLNAYYYDALRSAAKMARLLSDPSAADYEKRAEAVKSAMNQHLWDTAAHAYRDSLLPDGKLSPKITQQTNSLCVLFDIAPKAEQARILDTIYAAENKGKIVEAGSPYFSYYQLAALYHAERDDQALTYIRERWGRMLDWGATTWWEMWNPGASFCHGWSGGPTYNLPSEVLGIKPLKPGFKEVLVEPKWVGLQHASAVVPTAAGDVSVAWQRDGTTGSVALRVETPKDLPAEVQLPPAKEFRVNKKSTVPKGITLLPTKDGSVRLRVEQGGTLLVELKER